jgi:Peptidase family M23
MYSWPLQPFDQPHPVRAYFDDPRVSGSSKAFHFGIDISAPNGTAVYAVEAGTVHLQDPRAIAVVQGDAEFGYWHVVPAVQHRQQVARHELLGHIDAPWLHVHFAERANGEYRNPLRAGALIPWRDTTRPSITRVTFSRRGVELPPTAVHGPIDVIVEAHDTPPIPVPSPWNDLPVTPARLRWRVLRGSDTIRAWHTPIDFRTALLPQSAFDRIYAPGTRQNHSGTPGLYRFYLAHRWSTTVIPDGSYKLQVEAMDLAGNTGTRTQRFTVANDV